MIISRPSLSTHTQLQLFDKPIKSVGASRVLVGAFYEELTAKVFGGRRHTCSPGADYCPDVSIDERIYLECKSVGHTGKVMVYEGRLEKDWDFSRKRQLFYVIWRHRVRAKYYHTEQDLQAALLMGTLWCAVVPFDEIWKLCKATHLVKLNSKFNYTTGYQVPIKCIEPWKLLEWRYAGQAVNMQVPRSCTSRKKKTMGVPDTSER